MLIDSNLLEILVCPECKGPLDYQAQQKHMTCHRCHLAYPINEHDVPVLIIDDAVPYQPSDNERQP